MPHDHPHPTSRDHSEPRPAFDKLLSQVLAKLDHSGLLTSAEVTAQIEDMEGRTPTEGARLVARCWADPEFLDLARKDLPAAAAKLGVSMPAHPVFLLLENTEELHHVVVCTLCSCYPRPILGPPPVWYKSRNYRSRVVVEPREVLAEFGTVIREKANLRVVDSTADCRYLVLPLRPRGTENLTEKELADLVTRDSMIGVTNVSM
ncbi:nitrile hydratase subunit alpha [Epibacterium ulvae]|uniref:nitrile hydratase subunit alpha n=1 Tax=Epibacterium ulvae TaxID=1156985 RepID=UPI001BFCB1CC|nr:nitrile hydratase subunit alpha [Epibacterium ulvae]MBT8155202.1 nitrile hydratase subunit alpha [Epibacterium ulvae]